MDLSKKYKVSYWEKDGEEWVLREKFFSLPRVISDVTDLELPVNVFLDGVFIEEESG